MSEERKAGKDERAPEGLTFRYSREKRLEGASENVRWLASRYGAKRPSFFAGMVATRSSRFLLAVIVLCALFFLLYPIINGKVRKSGSLEGAKFSASALYFDGRVLVALKRVGKVPQDTLSLRASLSEDLSAAKLTVFPSGTEEEADYRLALDSSGERPKMVYLRLGLGEGSLSLAVPIE